MVVCWVSSGFHRAIASERGAVARLLQDEVIVRAIKRSVMRPKPWRVLVNRLCLLHLTAHEVEERPADVGVSVNIVVSLSQSLKA